MMNKYSLLKSNCLSMAMLLSLVILPAMATNGTGGSSGGSKLTWQMVFDDSSLRAEFKTFEIENYLVPYYDLCLIGEDKIRTKKRYLIGWTTNRSESNYYYYDYLQRERIMHVDHCDSGSSSCDEEELIDEIPLQMSVEIEKFDSGFWAPIETKTYLLNECKNQELASTIEI